MTDDEIRALSARETASAVRSGRLDPARIAAAFAGRIAARDPDLQAMAAFDPGLLRTAAASLDRGAPLAGVTLGVKDIIDTADLPTAYGSPIYAGHRPPADAAAVALARAAGMLVVGKTVSTEFATLNASRTRNPANPAHTPGGSSSGSAAGVAAGLMQVAFATQTAGSIIRPAAFCGVAGYKPTFGLLPLAGIKMLAWSLDTLGLIARSADDLAFVAASLVGDPDLDGPVPAEAIRFGLFEGSRADRADPAAHEALDRAAAAIAANGGTVRRLAVPNEFDRLHDHQAAVMSDEAYRALAHERLTALDRLGEQTRRYLLAAAATTRAAYREGLAAIAAAPDHLEAVLGPVDVAITFAAPGEAPAGHASTGDPVFNQVWTLLRGPCVTLPAGRGPGGLPLGVQLVARQGDDARLLAAARWLETALGDGGR